MIPIAAFAGLIGAMTGAGRRQKRRQRAQARRQTVRTQTRVVHVHHYHAAPMSPQRAMKVGKRLV